MTTPSMEARLPGLAPRSVRFLAGCVDAFPTVVLLLAFVLSGVSALGFTAVGLSGQHQLLDRSKQLFVGAGAWVVFAVSGALFALLVLYQWYLLSTRGQTIGKRLFGIRIVDLEGRPAGFVRALFLRRWVFLGLALLISGVVGTLLPLLGTLVWWLDWVPLFGEDRRCLHDYLAGTQVRWVRVVEVYVGRLAGAAAGVGLVGLAVVGVMNRDLVLPQVNAWLGKGAPPVVTPPAPTAPGALLPAPPTTSPSTPEPASTRPAPPPPEEPPMPSPSASEPPPPAPAEEAVYQFTDEQGVVHVTDDLANVPERYRAKAKRP